MQHSCTDIKKRHFLSVQLKTLHAGAPQIESLESVGRNIKFKFLSIPTQKQTELKVGDKSLLCEHSDESS